MTTLRETMLSSVRLPEGIPEVDRMYAFPEELAAMAPNLEVYLKRVFSESTLVDRLYFRGFYLTSGLQTGAPIAKVCAELLGSTGEADKPERRYTLRYYEDTLMAVLDALGVDQAVPVGGSVMTVAP